MRHWLVRATAALLRVDTLEAADPSNPEDYIEQYEGHPDTDVGAYVSSVDGVEEVTEGVYAVEPDVDSIAELVDGLGVNSVELVDPIEGIEMIEDESDKCYVWKLKNPTPDFEQRLSDKITDVYRGEPDALHFFVENVEDLKELDYQTLEHEIIPWLADAKTLNDPEIAE